MTGARVAVFAALAATGCADLEGKWDGQVDCGSAGSVDMSLDVASTGDDTYNADGTIVGLVFQGAEAGIEIELDLKQKAASGAQTLKVSAECVLYIDGENPQKLDCAGFDEIGWDGADEMAAKVDNYMGTGYTCDIDLGR